MKKLFLGLLLFLSFNSFAQTDPASDKPLRVGIAGLSHEHVRWILGREKKNDYDIVGIAEPDKALAERFSKEYGFDMKLWYPSLKEMLKAAKPEAVMAYNSIYEHLSVVEQCAPLGIHVMVEKPLAVNMDHAAKMLALAKQYKIHLLTNYETTWYGSNEKALSLLKEGQLTGPVKKVIFHTGHKGPIEIGCDQEFLHFLTDPVLNGGGAITDFGCYGADIATWFFQGELPDSVTAVTRQFKPQLYPKVDDEATIILSYKTKQVIIEASWNWPFGRKDMEVYGTKGYLFCKDGTHMLLREDEKKDPYEVQAEALPADRNDPFVYFKNVVRGKMIVGAYDPSAPATNEIVVKILDAARLSARTGKTDALRP